MHVQARKESLLITWSFTTGKLSMIDEITGGSTTLTPDLSQPNGVLIEGSPALLEKHRQTGSLALVALEENLISLGIPPATQGRPLARAAEGGSLFSLVRRTAEEAGQLGRAVSGRAALRADVDLAAAAAVREDVEAQLGGIGEDHDALQVVDAAQRRRAGAQQPVALGQAGRVRRRLGPDAQDAHGPWLAGGERRGRLELFAAGRNAEQRTPHLAVVDEDGGHPAHGLGGDREAQPLGIGDDGGVDADHGAGGVDQRAAGVARLTAASVWMRPS